MRIILHWWRDISIRLKLHIVVGIMACLIAGELVSLRFAMKNLSAVRAFVGGESLWSKAQKNAVFSLQRYAVTHNEKDYEAFLDFLKVPEGDHLARMELLKPRFDREIVRRGFLAGHIHPDDIDPIVELLRRFYWISYLSRAIDIWKEGDELLFQLKVAGLAFREAWLAKDSSRAHAILANVKSLNEELTTVEEEFSSVLGEGSRWLETVVLTILTIAVLLIESVGLGLTFFTSRSISRGLIELGQVAGRIGEGDFKSKLSFRSRDEIGQLGQAVNTMGQMLQRSYGELERRVQERTVELERVANENAQLYEQARKALESRDDFLSIASHELKTPLTALFLQLQRLDADLGGQPGGHETKKLEALSRSGLESARKIVRLVNELLDLTRMRIGKFELHCEPCDLSGLAREVVAQARFEAERQGSRVTFKGEEGLVRELDRLRMGQVLTNLLSNAIKYGAGKPIELTVIREGENALIQVQDHGNGIPEDQIQKIFERFERGAASSNIAGLGLGLYISMQIVKAHKGTIEVRSRVGEGTRFTVRI